MGVIEYVSIPLKDGTQEMVAQMERESSLRKGSLLENHPLIMNRTHLNNNSASSITT